MQTIKLLEACESVVESDPDMSIFFLFPQEWL